MYEGRTRGKRMKYTYSDGEEDSGTERSTRRSTRNASPLDNGPTVTASGRQVKPRMGGAYGESMLIDQRRGYEQGLDTDGVEDSDDMPTTTPAGRPARAGARNPASRSREVLRGDGMQSDDDSDGAESSGKEWSGNEEEPDVSEEEPDFDDDEVSDDEIDGIEPEDDKSLVVKLSYRKKPSAPPETVHGLPVLQPKAEPMVIVKEAAGQNTGNESTVEVPNTQEMVMNGTSERKEETANLSGGDLQEQALAVQQPMMNGYGSHKGVMQAAHSPHAPSPLTTIQAMDVS